MTAKRLNIDLIEDLFVREELIRLYEENEQLKKQLNTFKPIIFEDTNGGSSILYEKVKK